MTHLDIPKPPDPGHFATIFRGIDLRTQTCQSGEDIMVDPQGKIWFTQAGAGVYNGIYPDHSRIVSYDPNGLEQERFKVYNIPGDRNGITGITYDLKRKRIWFSQNRRQTSDTFATVKNAKLISFDPEKIPYSNHFDFAPVENCIDGFCSVTCYQKCITHDDWIQ